MSSRTGTWQAAPMAQIAPPPFLSAAWWDALAAAWNESGHTAGLARFGTAAFRVTDLDAPPIWLRWDEAGRAARCAPGRRDDPAFSATRADWAAFFAGRLGAGMAVLRLRIRFRGPVRRVLPYLGAFNQLANTARPLL